MAISATKLVILKTVSFQDKKGFNTHRLLRAIDNNTLLSKLPISEQGKETDVMLSEKTLKELYSEFPVIITNTQQVLDSCTIEFDFSKEMPKNQTSYTNNEALDFKLLRKLAYSGLNYRYQKIGKRVFERLEKELEIIKQKAVCILFFNQLENFKICQK